jgi:hypothetical protein
MEEEQLFAILVERLLKSEVERTPKGLTLKKI